MGEQFDRSASMKEICRGIRQCACGEGDKDTPADWKLHSLTKGKRLRDSLITGKYKMRPGIKVQIYRPKRREAIAPWFRDRVWQRSMCNNGVYHDLTRTNIFDNMACQKGKGTDLTIRRVIKVLQRLYRESGGSPVFGDHLDLRRFFPSTPQDEIAELDREKITEPLFLPHILDIVYSVQDPREPEEVTADPFGPRGTGLGSQVNQLNQVALPDKIDHEIVCLGVDYIRYNDDFLILSTDRAKVQQAKEIIWEGTKVLGLTPTDKSGIFNARHGFTFVGKRFILTDTGKVIIRLHKGAMQDERQSLRLLKADLDAGLTDMGHVQRHYQSWVANAEYAGDAPIRAMDQYYTQLFRQKPVYKRSRRYLYGKPKNQKHKHPPAGTAAGERQAAGDCQPPTGNAGVPGGPE